jgi:hypothetical protein
MLNNPIKMTTATSTTTSAICREKTISVLL